MPTPVEKLPCPGCGHSLSHVEESRSHVSTTGCMQTWRRRRCLACGGKYTTLADERAVTTSYTPPPTFSFSIEITTTGSSRVSRE